MHHDELYETILASDIQLDGMSLELWLRDNPTELVLSAFYSDADGSFEFRQHRNDIPPEVEQWFREEARRRLPPLPNQ